MTEEANIRFLFKKVDHYVITSAIEAMKAKIVTSDAGSITYTTVANHMNTAVSKMLDYISKNC